MLLPSLRGGKVKRKWSFIPEVKHSYSATYNEEMMSASSGPFLPYYHLYMSLFLQSSLQADMRLQMSTATPPLCLCPHAFMCVQLKGGLSSHPVTSENSKLYMSPLRELTRALIFPVVIQSLLNSLFSLFFFTHIQVWSWHKPLWEWGSKNHDIFRNLISWLVLHGFPKPSCGASVYGICQQIYKLRERKPD